MSPPKHAPSCPPSLTPQFSVEPIHQQLDLASLAVVLSNNILTQLYPPSILL